MFYLCCSHLRFPCTLCNYEATRNEYLKKHLAEKHPTHLVLNLVKERGTGGGDRRGGVDRVEVDGAGPEDSKPLGLTAPFLA